MLLPVLTYVLCEMVNATHSRKVHHVPDNGVEFYYRRTIKRRTEFASIIAKMHLTVGRACRAGIVAVSARTPLLIKDIKVQVNKKRPTMYVQPR